MKPAKQHVLGVLLIVTAGGWPCNVRHHNLPGYAFIAFRLPAGKGSTTLEQMKGSPEVPQGTP